MPTFRQDTKIGGMVPMMKTDDYNDQSVTEEKLKDGAITTRKIADGSVTKDKLDSSIRQEINDSVTASNEATEKAKEATSKADQATENAKQATAAATAAKEAADTATESANNASLSVSTVKEAAEKAAKLASTATSESLKATAQSKNATAKAEEATARANEVSHNPPKLGDDGYWYVFNEHKREYVKTEHYSKGGVDYPTFFIDDSDSCLYVSANNDSDKERFSLEDGNLCLTVN